jgi:hypothetical protein
MQKPMLLSRKIWHSVNRNVQTLLQGTFDESNIKELLIDLREFSLMLLKSGAYDQDSAMKGKAKAFIDLCHFVAHSNRDQGTFEDRIREQAQRLADALSANDDEAWRLANETYRVSTDRTITELLLCNALLLLQKYDSAITLDSLAPAFMRHAEIGLCVISLLQDSLIELKQDSGYALLSLMKHEGKLRLYCTLRKSKIQKSLSAQHKKPVKISYGFPVIATSASDIDGILNEAPTFLTTSGNTWPSILVETYRDADNALRIRPISSFDDA